VDGSNKNFNLQTSISISLENPSVDLSVSENTHLLFSFNSHDFVRGVVSLKSRFHAHGQDITNVLFSYETQPASGLIVELQEMSLQGSSKEKAISHTKASKICSFKILVAAAFLFFINGIQVAHAALNNEAEQSTEQQKKGFSFSLMLTTDYLWRGVSQTHRTPAFQPEVDYDLPINEATAFYAGVWGTNIKNDDYPDTKVELEYWAGLTHDFGAGFSGVLEALYYDYPSERDLAYGEISASLSKSLDLPLKPEVSLGETWAWDTYGTTGTNSFYTELNVKLSLPKDVGLVAHYGYSRFVHEIADQNWADWKLALTKEVSGNDLELGYYCTNASQYGRDGVGHLIFSVNHHF
jgi:uncharacterized protein (TIGR02001 family)